MIVCFDPGRNLGVCKAPARNKRMVVPGASLVTRKLRDTTDIGAFLKSADDPIREALAGASAAYIEAPNTQGQNHSGILKNCSLASHIAYFATWMGVPWHWVNLKHAKIMACDNGNARKEEMIGAAAFQLGLGIADLDEHMADSFWIYMVASFGVPKSASQRAAEAATKRRLAREAERAARDAAKLRARDPLF